MPLFLILFVIVGGVGAFYGFRIGYRYVGPLIIALFLLPFRILGYAFGVRRSARKE